MTTGESDFDSTQIVAPVGISWIDWLEDLRKCIHLCRMFRKDAMRRKDWRAEIFAERKLNEARKRFKAAKSSNNAR